VHPVRRATNGARQRHSARRVHWPAVILPAVLCQVSPCYSETATRPDGTPFGAACGVPTHAQAAPADA
jgi:hypothetical protein